jgi:hypothetical protein
MKTPLTDAVLSDCRNKPVTTGYLAMAAHAEALEIDRAALMGALELAETYLIERGIATRGTMGRTVVLPKMQAALSTARANFP